MLGYVCFKKSVTDEVPRLVQDSDALNKTIREALDDSLMTSVLCKFKVSDPLTVMIEAFQCQVHRGLVLMESGKEAMVSQIDLVRVLYENVSRWDEQLLNMSVDDVLSGETVPVTEGQSDLVVHDQTHAITAFKKMFIHQADGLCVVDSNGGIVADFNASDLEGLADHDLNILEKPVLEFLSIVHDGKIPEVVLCYKSTPLKHLLERCVKYSTHRVLVQSAEGKLEGVVTLSDVIKVFV